MRALAALIRALLMLVLLAPVPLQAADYADKAALDSLFEQLRNAPDEATADSVTSQIWQLWLNPTDVILAGQMKAAEAAEANGNFQAELSILTGVVADFPDYAEGWNRRATLFYIINDFASSLADIEKVLALEPRHFGALSGKVMIELRLGRRSDALRDMLAALAIHPFLSTRMLFPELEHNIVNI